MNFKNMADASCSGLIRSLCLAIVTLGVLFATTGANAGCGDLMGAKPATHVNIPFSAQPELATAQASDQTSIVGLWHVTYTSRGELFYEAFDQWHSDGTEFENANVPPTIGNVCLGTWKQTGGSIQLSHIGWNFDTSGNPIGTFTLTETNSVVAGGNQYKGNFDYKVFDVNGILTQEVTGSQTATRITVH